MKISPHTLALVVTHRCTAACDHCAFHCSPLVGDTMPVERAQTLIDEAAALGIQVVVFTGGEPFTLGAMLDELVHHASSQGLLTRVVTNGYWATSHDRAARRLASLVAAGLSEINFSTGDHHALWVSPSRVATGAAAAANAGLRVLVNVEHFAGAKVDVEQLYQNEEFAELVRQRKVFVQHGVWMPNFGATKVELEPELMRAAGRGNVTGCGTILSVLAVTPQLELYACCGLALEFIPELMLGSVEVASLGEVLESTADDLLLMWLKTDGPERILDAVQEQPGVSGYSHPCEACMRLFSDKRLIAEAALKAKRQEGNIVADYMGWLAADQINKAVGTGDLLLDIGRKVGVPRE